MDYWIIILTLVIIIIACVIGVLYYMVKSLIEVEFDLDEDDADDAINNN